MAILTTWSGMIGALWTGEHSGRLSQGVVVHIVENDVVLKRCSVSVALGKQSGYLTARSATNRQSQPR